MNLTSFAHHASRACTGHAELALALAAEFRAPVPGVDAALEELARALPVRRHARADDQLAACADLLAGRLQATALSWSGIDDLLLDRVLASGAGHPLALAHQVAARILNRIGERAERTGNVAWALRAAELRLALPFTRPVRDELVHLLAHLRSRLN
jgi:hypothetical protein